MGGLAAITVNVRLHAGANVLSIRDPLGNKRTASFWRTMPASAFHSPLTGALIRDNLTFN